MEFRVLGPMEVSEAGRRLEIGPRLQRAVLAVLVIEANRVVSVDRLAEALWGDDLPGAATGVLQGYVSNLRRVLEPERAPRTPARFLLTRPPGYVLQVPPDSVDAARFENLASEGRALIAAGRPDAGRDTLRRALALWGGGGCPMPTSMSTGSSIQKWPDSASSGRSPPRTSSSRARRRSALDGGARARAPGRRRAERERRWALLMLALYRCGRQADALRAYQKARHTLGDELGIEPGPALRRLESLILGQDRAIDWQPAPPDSHRAAVPPTPAPRPVPGTVKEAGRAAVVGRVRELATLSPSSTRRREGGAG